MTTKTELLPGQRNKSTLLKPLTPDEIRGQITEHWRRSVRDRGDIPRRRVLVNDPPGIINRLGVIMEETLPMPPTRQLLVYFSFGEEFVYVDPEKLTPVTYQNTSDLHPGDKVLIGRDVLTVTKVFEQNGGMAAIALFDDGETFFFSSFYFKRVAVLEAKSDEPA